MFQLGSKISLNLHFDLVDLWLTIFLMPSKYILYMLNMFLAGFADKD